MKQAYLMFSFNQKFVIFCQQSGESLAVSFGRNLKSQQSARTLFALAHRHGDILREGWKNIMDCMLQLFKAKLLPKSMVEVLIKTVSSKCNSSCLFFMVATGQEIVREK